MDRLIAVSRAIADKIVAEGRDGAPVELIYNGVDLAKWSAEPAERDREIRAKHGVAESSYVLCVGAADWQPAA